ncbi:hypothetical protein AAF712_013535 [Marasmius tenuissimus]|uniref:Uncharacterized protein n=1 Tax=Marasmius tenuissimus TaxID=585030 RepID=A0ABR2ZDG0_9AGAR
MSSHYFRPRCLEHTELVEPASIIAPSTGPQRNHRVRRSSTPPYNHPRRTASPPSSPASARRPLAADSSDSSSEEDASPPDTLPRPRTKASTRKSPTPAPGIRPASQPLEQAEATSPPSVDGYESECSLNVPDDVPREADREDRDSLPKIPKPEGEAGRPKRGGYNLEEKLGWDSKVLSQVKSFVKDQVLSKLNCSAPFTSQPPDKLEEIRASAIDKFPMLMRYEDCWAVDDFIRCHLKYQKQKLMKEENEALAAKTRAREQAREERKALESIGMTSRKR